MKRKIFILLLISLSLSLIAEKGEVYFNKGITYILINDASLAQENMNRYFNINPNPVLRRGFEMLISGDTEGAINRFRDYLNMNHRSTPALVGIALSTADMEVSNTMEVLERAIRLNRAFSSAYLCLGMEYMKKKNFPSAVGNLNRALGYANIPEYKIILGELYLLLNDPQKVIALLKREADNSPDNFYYNFLLANAYFRLNNYSETGIYIEAALEVKPGSNEAKLLMAKYLVGINELKRARSILKGLNFKDYNKDYVKTYAQVLLELKDRNVEDYLYEFFAREKWDKAINSLMGRYYQWNRGKGNVQNWIIRAILSGDDINQLKKIFPGDYRFPEYKYIPFFNVKKIKWISEKIILAAAINKSGEKEKIFVVDTETMRVIKTLNFRGKFQDIFLPQNYDSSGAINIILSTMDPENKYGYLYAIKIAGRNILLRPIPGLAQPLPSVVVGFNKPGNLAYITDGSISTIAFESPFSKVSTLGRKRPIYPLYPFTIYQYNFNNYRLGRVSDPEQMRRVPIKEVQQFFLIADAYQDNSSIKGLINKGERLELTSTEVVRTYISNDLSSFIIYLSDLDNAFQALIYDSRSNRVRKVDETMFLGKGQYAEIQIFDFCPREKELVVMTKDKEQRLISFNYDSFLYLRLEKKVYDFCRDRNQDMIYVLTERSKKKYFTETNLDVISLNPYSRERISSKKDLNEILLCDQCNEVYFSTYNGELLKMDAENKFHYVGPSFDGAVSSVSQINNKKAVFINGRLLVIE